MAVIGVPDPRWGEAVKGIITAPGPVGEKEIVPPWRGPPAGDKGAQSVGFLGSLPPVPSGKVSKKELRDRYWDSEGRGVA